MDIMCISRFEHIRLIKSPGKMSLNVRRHYIKMLLLFLRGHPVALISRRLGLGPSNIYFCNFSKDLKRSCKGHKSITMTNIKGFSRWKNSD